MLTFNFRLLTAGPPYWIVKLIVGAAFDDAGLADTGNEVVPVTVTLSVPEDDGDVVESPRYAALTVCVPTSAKNAGALAAVTVMVPVVPPTTGAIPRAAPSTRNSTLPVGVPPVTVALTVMLPFTATFVVETVKCVVVGVNPPPPPPPPPQPTAKANTQTRLSPSAAR